MENDTLLTKTHANTVSNANIDSNGKYVYRINVKFKGNEICLDTNILLKLII